MLDSMAHLPGASRIQEMSPHGICILERSIVHRKTSSDFASSGIERAER